MKYAWIEEHRGDFTVRACCRVLGVSVSGYYRHRSAAPSARVINRQATDKAVAEVHAAIHGIYGSRKVAKELKLGPGDIVLARNTVAASMRRQGLQSKVNRPIRPRTTQSDPQAAKDANVLDRDFEATGPNQKWVTDITYLPTADRPTDHGWVYLALVTDLFARKIVGWAIADHMKTSLVVDAIRQAVEDRRPGPGLCHPDDVRRADALLLHSDRGCQFTSEAFRTMLGPLGIRQSMSRVGECYDNAVAESVFGSLKGEWIDHEHYTGLADARLSVIRYIGFYNGQRRHQSLGYQTPNEKERRFHQDVEVAFASPAATVAAAG